MKTLISTRLLALAAIAFGAFVAAPAAFAQGTFTPGTGTTANCNPNNPPTTFDSVSCTVGSVSVSMTAWGYMSALSTTATTGWVQGRVGDFNASGFGAYTGNKESTTDAQHAFDNVTSGCGSTSGANGGSIALSAANSGCGGAVEAVLLNFGASKVSLSQVGIGYYSTDADMSIYAWTGGGDPTMSTQTLKSSTTGAGTMAGWTLVGSKDVDNVGNSWAGISSASYGYSSYFLITTYFGASTGSNGAALDGGNDRFKINSFTVACQTANCGSSNTPGVPEPASLALASLGLVSLLGIRRRGQRKPD